MRAYDLIVIGGGLVGGAIAWGAARQGARVALLDEGDIALRAARGNFGLVWVQSKGLGNPAYAHWSRRSAELWPHLSDALGGRVALRQNGGFTFCLSDAEFEQRAALVTRMHNESGGIGTRMICRDDLRAMLPAIGDRVVGAAFCPADGHANPLLLLQSLQSGMTGHGGDYLPGRTVDDIAYDGGFTVTCGAERFLSDKIVIAAGLGSRILAPMVGLSMPVTPLKGQILITERLRPFLDHATHITRQTDEGSVMMGDSLEDAGFDISSTVGVLKDIAARNMAVFPGLRDANIVRVWAALRVMSPDGAPIYEQSETCPGAFSATCHSGVTLAGAHALDIAPAILKGELPEAVASFAAGRFAQGAGHVQAF